MNWDGEKLENDPRYRVLAAIARNPSGLTRQALASAADIAPATLSLLLRGQEGQDLSRVVVEAKAERAASGGGPRPNIVRLRDGIYVAGIEIGHGHVRVGVAGLDGRLLPDSDGRYYDQEVMPVFKERRQTLNWIAGGLNGKVGALSHRLSRVFARQSQGDSGSSGLEKPLVLGVGVSVAGAVDPDDGRLVCTRPVDGSILREEEGTIACADWDGESAGQGLRDRLRGGDRTEIFGWNMTRFRSASASELCAKAELLSGALGKNDFAIFIKWTGNVSAAVVLGGNVFVGARGLAGGFPMHSSQSSNGANGNEPERLPLGIAVGIRRLTEAIRKDLGISKRQGSELLRDFFRSEILSIAHREKEGSGDREVAIVKDHLGNAATLLGRALAPTVDMLDPSKIVVGGGVFESRDWTVVGEPLSEAIRANVMAPGRAPEVALAEHSEHPALSGAIASRLDPLEAVPILLRACDGRGSLLHGSGMSVLVSAQG